MYGTTGYKLQYLEELRAMLTVPLPEVIRADIARRMQQVCDSIEKDILPPVQKG